MTAEEKDLVYQKLMSILILMEEMDNNMALMELEHFIEWIAVVTDKGTERVSLSPGEKPQAVFVDKGNAKTDIIEKANTENVNYMVMGTHGRTGISHVFMGSTAEYIIRHATKPILVIPMNTLKH